MGSARETPGGKVRLPVAGGNAIDVKNAGHDGKTRRMEDNISRLEEMLKTQIVNKQGGRTGERAYPDPSMVLPI